MPTFHEISTHFGAAQASTDDKVALYLASLRQATAPGIDADNASSTGICTDEDCLCMLSGDQHWSPRSSESTQRTLAASVQLPFPIAGEGDANLPEPQHVHEVPTLLKHSRQTSRPSVSEVDGVEATAERAACRAQSATMQRKTVMTSPGGITVPFSPSENTLPVSARPEESQKESLGRIFSIGRRRLRSNAKTLQASDPDAKAVSIPWRIRLLQLFGSPRHLAFRV